MAVTPEADALEQFYLRAIRDDENEATPATSVPSEETLVEVLMNGRPHDDSPTYSGLYAPELTEYIRSGRILVELTLAVAFWGLFFQNPRGFVTLNQVFQLSGIFTLLLTLYTTSAMLSLADRPQGYIVLTRPLGRRGYLLGLYIASVLVVWVAFLVILCSLSWSITRSISPSARS